MYAPEGFVVINRPEIDPATNKPRWNLIAREIGGAVLLTEVEETVWRQSAVLDALSNGISDPQAIADYANSVHGMAVEDPRKEVSGAIRRYKAATGFEALSLAIADKSVKIDERAPTTVPVDIAHSFNLLASGSTPKEAATANGVNVHNEQQVRSYLVRLCREFGVKSLYAALRLAHEYGVVSGSKRPEESVLTVQVGFALPFREPKLSPSQLQVGRLRAGALDKAAIARKRGVGIATVKTQMQGMYKKLEAHNAAEAVTKLIVLRLAKLPTNLPHYTDNISVPELSALTGVAQGLENAEIADAMGATKDQVTEDQVKEHLRNVNHKLGTYDRAGSVLSMFQAGVFRAEEMTDVPAT